MKRLNKAFLHNALAVFIIFFAVTSVAQTNFWQQTNGPWGGTILAFAINREEHIFAGTEGSGVFRSIDNGDTWCQTGLTNTTVRALAINSITQDIFAGTNGSGVFHSNDNGETWRAINSGLTNTNVYALAINSNGHIFAGTNGGGIFRSLDNGVNWTRINTGLTNTNVYALAINNNGHIFAGTFGGGVFRSTDNGTNWTQLNTGLTNTFVQVLAIDSAGHIFAGTVGGVFRSTDNGQSWSQTDFTNAVNVLAVKSNGHIFAVSGGLYRSTNNGRTWTRIFFGAVSALIINRDGHIFVGTNGGGVFRSTDNGQNWSQINTGLTNTIIQALAINPATQDIFAGIRFGGGIFRSTDNGENWHQPSTFLSLTFIQALVINSNGHIFAGTLGNGVYRSIDNGAFWSSINTGLTNTAIQVLTINNNGHIFAGTSGGVFRSTNNGDSWSPINSGLTNLSIRALAINNNGHIFAGTFGGVFRSIDNGDNWSPINTGLTNLFVNALVINPVTQDIFAGVLGRVFRSTNNGDNWTPTGLTRNVNAFAANSQGNIFAGTPDGAFRSIDNGVNWSLINTGLSNTNVIALTVNSNDVVFAGTSGGGVFRSEASSRNVAAANVNTQAGGTVNIPLRLVAQGDENILRFSLNFDPAILSNPQARLGGDASAATLNLNSSQAGSGRYGVELTLPAGQKFAAGTREILVVSFSVNPTKSGISTTVGFGDQPTCREMINAIGTSLISSWASGKITITPPIAVKVSSAGAALGSTVSLPINLLSQGGENALGFSLNFNPAILSNAEVKLGKDAGSATLNINANQAGSGRLGLTLALPTGQSFAAGTHEIAVVTFSVNPNTTEDSTHLELGDQPVTREVVDVNANALFTTWTGGKVRIVSPPAAPTLSMPLDGAVNQPTTLTLNWNPSTSAETYRLQVSTRADFSTTVVDDSTMTTTSRQVGLLANSTVYYWRVRAKNIGGTSAYSEIRHFTTIVQLPSPVILLSPASAAILPSGNVKFTWQKSQPAVDRYWFEIATDSSMANSVKDSTLTAADTIKVVFELNNKQTYWWRVRAGNVAGWGAFSEKRRFSIDVPVSVEETETIPTEFSLSQNYPNPFNPSTMIKYDLAQQAEVKLEIFDMLGRHVRTLVDQRQQAGRYAITWDGRNEQGQSVASGTFIYQLRAGDPSAGSGQVFVQTRRMALVR